MLVAAAVCPHPPLLVPEVMGAAGGRGEGGMDEVLAACDAAVAGLKAAGPDMIVVVGGAEADAVYEGPVAGSLAEYGVRVGAGANRWATISIPWLAAPKTPITAMTNQTPIDPGGFQTHGNIGVRTARPAT